MPFIVIRWVAGRSKAQKAELAEAITEAVERIGKTPRAGVKIVFEDVERDDWADGGVLKSDQVLGGGSAPSR
jgi:4-oxalocrotonate tautomerase